MSFRRAPEIRRFPLFAMLAWSMGAGAIIDGVIAFATDRAASVRPPRPTFGLGDALSRYFSRQY